MAHLPQTPRSAGFGRYLTLRTGNLALDFSLILVPVAFVIGHVSSSPVLIFIASALGIIPLAAALGKATEDL